MIPGDELAHSSPTSAKYLNNCKIITIRKGSVKYSLGDILYRVVCKIIVRAKPVERGSNSSCRKESGQGRCLGYEAKMLASLDISAPHTCSQELCANFAFYARDNSLCLTVVKIYRSRDW